MTEQIKVHLLKPSGRYKYYRARYMCPNTNRQVVRSTKCTKKADALKFAGKWEDELKSGRYKPASKTTWREFRERYEDEVLASLADRTAETVASVFNVVERILRPEGLSQITADRLSLLQRSLREANRREATIKKYLAHLLAALKWGQDQGMLNEVPVAKMPRRAKASKVMKGRPITLEEFERILLKVPLVLFPNQDRRKKHTTHLPNA